jgi:FkbM family methyltransferase
MKLPDVLPPGVDTILHIGAGRCRELEDYLAATPRQLVLVEPNPDLAAELRQRTAESTSITIIEAAVSREGGTGVLSVFNVPSASSLRNPTALHQFYPGLAVKRRVPVQSLTLAELLERVKLSTDAPNVLVFDAPGEEHALVSALLEIGRLDVSRLVLHCSLEPLYEEARSSKDIISSLEEAGYSVNLLDNTVDPDRPIWVAQTTATLRRLQEIEEELTNAETSIASLKTACMAAEAGREAAEAAVREQTTRAEVAEASVKDYEAERASLRTRVAALEAAQESAETDLTAMRTRVTELEAACMAAEAGREAAEAAVREQTTRAEVAEASVKDHHLELVSVRKIAAEKETRLEELVSERDKLTSQLKQHEQRSTLIDIDLVRTEAQIALIRDVLIREKFF